MNINRLPIMNILHIFSLNAANLIFLDWQKELYQLNYVFIFDLFFYQSSINQNLKIASNFLQKNTENLKALYLYELYYSSVINLMIF